MQYKHTKTNGKIENEYPKLVRNKIPEIVEKRTGEKPKCRIMKSDKEYQEYLIRKITEEASEFRDAKDKIHQYEEMADVMEIIDSLMALNKLKLSDVRKVQNQKNKERGGFKKRILMLKKAK
jgi:predicted house-cleaning noncanonical NTP pyrophosphatase (MazG superfamily)